MHYGIYVTGLAFKDERKQDDCGTRTKGNSLAQERGNMDNAKGKDTKTTILEWIYMANLTNWTKKLAALIEASKKKIKNSRGGTYPLT